MSDPHSRRCTIGECWSERHALDGWSADRERYALSEARAILRETEGPAEDISLGHAAIGDLWQRSRYRYESHVRQHHPFWALAEALRAFVDAPVPGAQQ